MLIYLDPVDRIGNWMLDKGECKNNVRLYLYEDLKKIKNTIFFFFLASVLKN